MRLTSSGNYFVKGTSTLVYKEKCLECGEPFLYHVYRPTDYCSKSCVRVGPRNVMYGRTHSEKTKGLLRTNSTGVIPSKETRHKMSIARIGPKNHNWKGGISKTPYCYDWTNCLKEIIKERDGYRCTNPCCISDNSFDDLNVHHIDYNKKNCNQHNLITLCRACNASANFNREWHEAWYSTIIYNRYKKGK